jgi:hypothetical protein
VARDVTVGVIANPAPGLVATGRDDEVELRLGEGPVRIDVGWVMAEAARRSVCAAVSV